MEDGDDDDDDDDVEDAHDDDNVPPCRLRPRTLRPARPTSPRPPPRLRCVGGVSGHDVSASSCHNVK
jgi:hypothetical protein